MTEGHWCRESAALERGASKQSQVYHNSYANVAQRSSRPKHPTTTGVESLLVRTMAEGPQSVRMSNTTNETSQWQTSNTSEASTAHQGIRTTQIPRERVKANSIRTVHHHYQCIWQHIPQSKHCKPQTHPKQPQPTKGYEPGYLENGSKPTLFVRPNIVLKAPGRTHPKQAQPTDTYCIAITAAI